MVLKVHRINERMNMEKVILVDEDDNELGLMSKGEAHKNGGLLHRAISVWVVNSSGEVLVTKRSRQKLLWPGYWSNTVCSHPRKGERYKEAGERRLMEELGFSCSLKYLYKFVYKTRYRDVGGENEMAGVLIGRYQGKIRINKDEISGFKWVDWKELERWSKREREKFTPWFFMEKERLGKISSFKKLVNI
jgi:isopentenyl-diphosphate delta-isomerase